MTSNDFDPDQLFKPFVIHETCRIFLTKVVTDNLVGYGTDFYNAYYYL